ncbi:pseudo histidine-containing phosphotransfer protein 5-like isoform X2 [Tasmannia lanceolata]|uniref:pseudo histidine-containing phosphotransfer protein 5-like isoform X2 n=1 Tax=Tasmannia lanceolata TaxID=3420 RepID=UPI0040641FB6
MENTPLQRQAAYMRKCLFEQDDENPNFAEEVVTLFYKDSSKALVNTEQELEKRPLDFSMMDAYMHKFKGSTVSIGALRLKNEISLFREYCKMSNEEGCIRTFEMVKKEHAALRKKLETYFQLLRQAGPVETATRPKSDPKSSGDK